MPVLREIDPSQDVRAGIWNITETDDQLLKNIQLNDNDRLTFASFKNQQRKKQWLGYRALLNHLLWPVDARLCYDPNGKPLLQTRSHHISVSHAGDLVAAVISKSIRVGVDVEQMRPRVERVKDRFMSDLELSHLPVSPTLIELYHYWCGKEALYKIHGTPGVDFRNDLLIHSIDYLCTTKGTGRATLKLEQNREEHALHWEIEGDYMLMVAYQLAG